MILFSSSRFEEHTTPPGHPERPERAEVFNVVSASFRSGGGVVREPRAARPEELARVHTAEYLQALARSSGRAVMLDADTYTSPESYAIALIAAGAAVDAASHAWRAAEPTMAFVRPPGHHAEADRAMGFCLLNNVAVAAAALRTQGAGRVAIVDFDVHHGNGTQQVFYADPNVQYVSTHQFPYYPGTGAVEETGAGAGDGFTLNLPLPAGARDDDYARTYGDLVVPALERFAPEVILVSAGYDAHVLDPLGGMRVTTAGYTRIVQTIDDAARRICGRRLVFVTEGGYHLSALQECLEATVGVLS